MACVSKCSPCKLTLTTDSLPNAREGIAYSEVIEYEYNCLEPLEWEAEGLPNGLEIDQDGNITGTPTESGTFTVEITISDGKREDTVTITLIVEPEENIDTVGSISAEYWQKIGTTLKIPYPVTCLYDPPSHQVLQNPNVTTADVVSDEIVITSSVVDDVLYAVTSTCGNHSVTRTFIVHWWDTLERVCWDDATDNFSGIERSFFTTGTPTVSGGIPPYTFEYTGLPHNLTYSSNGTISGTLTTRGTYTVTSTVTDSCVPPNVVTCPDFTIEVEAYIPPPVVLVCPGDITMDCGEQVSIANAASNGTPPFTYSATGLPECLEINSSTGTITGELTEVGEHTVTITVTDVEDETSSCTFTFTVEGEPLPSFDPLEITTVSLPGGHKGYPYSYFVQAIGGQGAYAWSEIQLPTGLSINITTGEISGIPTVVGSYTPTITVEDGN